MARKGMTHGGKMKEHSSQPKVGHIISPMVQGGKKGSQQVGNKKSGMRTGGKKKGY